MCIISIKAKGIPMPDEATIRTMFYNNDDGAGYMYAHRNKVYIKKGFMTVKEFMTSIDNLPSEIGVDDLTNTAIIMHFRIGTAGGNIPANTHPFPVSENVKALKALSYKTDLGVAHNGIIHSVTPRTGISDTMEYILSQMSILKKIDKKFYTKKLYLELMENAVESKLAFLDGKGNIYTVGRFTTDEETGLVYSNDSYKARKIYYHSNSSYKYNYHNSLNGYEGWYDLYGDDYWDDLETKNTDKNTMATLTTAITNVESDNVPDNTEYDFDNYEDVIIMPLSAYTDYLVFESGEMQSIDSEYSFGIDKFGTVYCINLDYMVATQLNAIAYTYENDKKQPITEPILKKFVEDEADIYEIIGWEAFEVFMHEDCYVD